MTNKHIYLNMSKIDYNQLQVNIQHIKVVSFHNACNYHIYPIIIMNNVLANTEAPQYTISVARGIERRYI